MDITYLYLVGRPFSFQVTATKDNTGGLYEVKFPEAKISTAVNIGASTKWDIFNTSYKLPKTKGN